jgi:hypothetical protein
LKENRRKSGIAFEEGSEALKRVLATGLSQMIVSTPNFPALVAERKRLTAAYAAEQGRASRQNQETHPRPELLDDYPPARNEKERQIVSLREELLGILPVGDQRHVLRTWRKFADRYRSYCAVTQNVPA